TTSTTTTTATTSTISTTSTTSTTCTTSTTSRRTPPDCLRSDASRPSQRRQSGVIGAVCVCLRLGFPSLTSRRRQSWRFNMFNQH
ncbi:hypothetical protein LSAT2_011598, partial [Lamellibrachia satsuma]